MTLLQLIFLALVQGITEFLPISSSAHLILVPLVMHWADQGPLIDIMAHAGTLLAVMVYFRDDVGRVLSGMADIARGRSQAPNARLFLLIALATPPALAAGAALYLLDLVDVLRNPVLIGVMTLVFGLALWAADRVKRMDIRVETMTYRAALIIGLAQALALVPGVSRSGITMTAARALGFSRPDAARFSMLISIPLIGAFAAMALLELLTGQGGSANLKDGLIVAALSFVSALIAIWAMMKWLERASFLPFVIYRLILGAVILMLFLA
jgi:undecaprenyl-diphosphatase